MQISTDELRKHYASLSDEGLREIDPADLTDQARKFYEDELKSRRLAREVESHDDDEYDESVALEMDDEEPEWLENASCVCSFRRAQSPQGADAATARDALLAAGVPCHISLSPAEPGVEDSPAHDEYQVMVPAGLHLKAKSVLDEQIFNPEVEASLRTHLAARTDEELSALSADDICAGQRDLLERMMRAYDEEIGRRRLV